MLEALVENEQKIRLLFFVSVFLIMAILEILIPRRRLKTGKKNRWLTNLGVIALASAILRILFALLPVAVPLYMVSWASENSWGLFNNLSLFNWVEFFLAIIIFDFAIYLQHRLFHAVPLLWRLHLVHHVDLDLDVTSGNRFHPIEIVLSIFIKVLAVLIIGPSAAALVTFEILLNVFAQFNHSNVKIPDEFESLLRKVIITPDFHRIHHSTRVVETNSNFGFNLSLWDYLFKTYRPKPEKGHEEMTLGLEQHQDPNQLGLIKILILPFKKQR